MQQTNSAGSSFFNSGRPHVLFRTIIRLGNAGTVVLLHPRLTLVVFSIGMQTGRKQKNRSAVVRACGTRPWWLAHWSKRARSTATFRNSSTSALPHMPV